MALHLPIPIATTQVAYIDCPCGDAQMATIENFNFADLEIGNSAPSVSATLPANPNGIFVAQIALTEVINAYAIGAGIKAYISGFTQLNGNFVELRDYPTSLEWFNSQSVTFVLTATTLQGHHDLGRALASVTNLSS
jgi:hypothetical protein